MRRSDREIIDLDRMCELLEEEEVLRLALSDAEGTYILPLNYGYKAENGSVSFFIHGAREGRKAGILQDAARDGREIPFEIDGRRSALVADSCSASYYYMSVIGKVKISVLEGDEKIDGLNTLMHHIMPAPEYHYQEEVLQRTLMCKLSVTEWSCKEHKA
ncbi:MAG: pyridoxamine 5'-phosphate oxidase family protein [Mogibacterium sp.]|nr:pyridoxamine 5'-phosphate oxidase family protein [Mogibacterium sp.]